MMAATNSAKPSKTISVDRVRRMSGCKRIMQNPHTPLHIMCAIAIAIAIAAQVTTTRRHAKLLAMLLSLVFVDFSNKKIK